MLVKNKLYTNEISDLLILVCSIIKEDDESIEINSMIIDKNTFAVLEPNQNYLLDKDSIKDWYIYNMLENE